MPSWHLARGGFGCFETQFQPPSHFEDPIPFSDSFKGAVLESAGASSMRSRSAWLMKTEGRQDAKLTGNSRKAREGIP